MRRLLFIMCAAFLFGVVVSFRMPAGGPLRALPTAAPTLDVVTSDDPLYVLTASLKNAAAIGAQTSDAIDEILRSTIDAANSLIPFRP